MQPGESAVSRITPCSFDGERLRTCYHSDHFRSIERHPGIELTTEERTILDFYDRCADDPASRRHLPRLWLSVP